MYFSKIFRYMVIIYPVLLCADADYILPSLPKCINSEGLDRHVEIPSQLMSNTIITTFVLIEQALTCPVVQHNIPIPIITELLDGNDNETVDSGDTKFGANGILKYESGNYWRNEYCLQSINETEAVISLCEISCSEPEGKICVPKCCPWGKMLHFWNASSVNCVEVEDSSSGVNWRPDVYHPHNASACLDADDKSPDCLHFGIPEHQFHYQNLFTGCDEENYTLDPIAFQDTPFAFGKDGILRVDDYKFDFENYCIDGFGNGLQSYKEPSHAALACICIPKDPYKDERNRIDVLYVVVMFISAFFLLLTVIVYILIWNKQNIHGWTVFSLSVSMGLMLIFLGAARLIALDHGKESVTGSGSCVFVGILAHFFFLTTFSLLTCLSFDLWWTFRTLAPSVGRSKGLQRFRMYIAFSVGFPLLIVSIGFILDKVYGHVRKYNRKSWRVILPEYGIDTCYISDKYAQGAYIFLPAAILLLANLLFFLTTMWIMYQYHKNTQTARKNSATQKQTLYLFTKLFFVMGVTWTVEVIEYLSGYGRQEKNEHNCPIFYEPGRAWIATDLFNILQGIAIFCIFVCKKSVMLHLSRRSSTLRVLVSPIFLLPCCKLNQMDLEAPSGKTNQSSVSMRTFTPRSQEMSESD